MSISLLFATNNQHKVAEILPLLPKHISIASLADAGINIDIPEPHNTLEANASEKSFTLHRLTGKNVFSEDTGLEVDALNGEPGVKSARYAGENRHFQHNIDKLLSKLGNEENRKAQFRTIVSLILDNKEYRFEGICKGTIIHEQRGQQGFGYDAIFCPEGSHKTFAEMSMEEKNNFSHRKKAVTQLIAFLTNYTNEQNQN